MNPSEYIARGLPIFPCHGGANPRLRKTPLTPNGFKDATIDPETVRRWLERYPSALWAMPTGTVSGIVVLDVDVKDPAADGFDSLKDLGRSILPETPLVHTASGGVHVYFRCPNKDIRNSAGKIGPGLDVRGNGGYVIVPTSGSGYTWDAHWNFDTVEPGEAPEWLWPPLPARPRTSAPPILQTDGLSRYAEAALDAACKAIIHAPAGQQEITLNVECFSIGTLAGAGGIPEELALKALLYAANRMRDHDLRWPWRPEEIDFKVRRAFADGLRHPREARRAA
jgi:Bifunctional DNA primase/polymerase, N-terminal